MAQVIGYPQDGALLSGTNESAAPLPVGYNRLPEFDGVGAEAVPVMAATTPGGVVRISDPVIEQEIVRLGGAEPYEHYFCHCFAGNHWSGDSRLHDGAAGNHFVPGAHLPLASLWGTPGVASTLTPVTGALNSVLRAPALNYDYMGGEKLILWWYGQCAPHASLDRSFLGDGNSTSIPGVRIRCKVNGKFDVSMADATVARFSAEHPQVVFDGTPHSVAFAIDGTTKTYAMWADEVLYSTAAPNYMDFVGKQAVDPRTTATFNVGSARSTGHTDGIAVQTRALAIMRLPATATMPTTTALTALFTQMRAAPHKLIRKGAL